MRLDLFLKTSRLVKRRATARELCENGRVLVNNQEAKPAKEVRHGDHLVLRLSARMIGIEIRNLQTPGGRKPAPEDMYIVTSDRRLPKEQDAWNENR